MNQPLRSKSFKRLNWTAIKAGKDRVQKITKIWVAVSVAILPKLLGPTVFSRTRDRITPSKFLAYTSTSVGEGWKKTQRIDQKSEAETA
jgi:hypothetical protein